MGEFKSVKAVDFEQKSTQEIEQELLAKHEGKGTETEPDIKKVVLKAVDDKVVEPVVEPVIEDKKVEETKEVEPVVVAAPEIDDDIVLSHIRKKFGREDLSYDNLLQEKIVEKELPADIEAYRKYKQETGRGINDFAKLSRDFSKETPEARIAEYKALTNPHYDADDIAFEMDDQFSFDEDVDDDREIKAKKLAKKKTLAEADKYLNEQKEMYKVPLESKDGFISDADKEAYELYKEDTKNKSERQGSDLKKKEHFSSKTNELFSTNFEGFGYKVGEDNITYKVSDVNSTKNAQSDAMNFINKHLDENGLLKDAGSYHKALNAAMDPDALFKFAYEKGAADALTRDAKEAKNVDMKANKVGMIQTQGRRFERWTMITEIDWLSQIEKSKNY